MMKYSIVALQWRDVHGGHFQLGRDARSNGAASGMLAPPPSNCFFTNVPSGDPSSCLPNGPPEFAARP